MPDRTLTADVPLGPFQDHASPAYSAMGSNSKLHAHLTTAQGTQKHA